MYWKIPCWIVVDCETGWPIQYFCTIDANLWNYSCNIQLSKYFIVRLVLIFIDDVTAVAFILQFHWIPYCVIRSGWKFCNQTQTVLNCNTHYISAVAFYTFRWMVVNLFHYCCVFFFFVFYFYFILFFYEIGFILGTGMYMVNIRWY